MNHAKIMQLMNLPKWWEHLYEFKQKVLPGPPLKYKFKLDMQEINESFGKACHRGDTSWVHNVVSSRDFQQMKKDLRHQLIGAGFTQACETGQLDCVKYLAGLKQYQQPIKERLGLGFVLGARYNQVSIMKFLESHFKADIFHGSMLERMESEIMMLCTNGATESLKYLFEHPVWNNEAYLDNPRHWLRGSDLYIVNAARRGHVEMMKYLVSRPFYTQASQDDKQLLMNEALFAACGEGRLTMINYLCLSRELEFNADLNRYGAQVLRPICRTGDMDLVKTYLNRFENPVSVIEQLIDNLYAPTEIKSFLMAFELEHKLQRDLPLQGQCKKRNKL